MNIFSYILAKKEIEPKPDLASRKFVIDDNIGEAIHIHYRNTRIEFSVEDYLKFADEITTAQEELRDGDC